jgi:hypothetical protein
MSTKAGTIQGAQTGTSWAGGRIAAFLLAVVLAVTLFAMNRSSGTSQPAPTTAKVETTVPAGFGHVAPATQPRMPIVNGSICHQCR